MPRSKLESLLYNSYNYYLYINDNKFDRNSYSKYRQILIFLPIGPGKLGLCLSALERPGDFIYYPILGLIDKSGLHTKE